MPFDPNEPADVAVWRINMSAARANLTREVNEARHLFDDLAVALDNGWRPRASDLRRLTAVMFEVSRYGTEVNTLHENTPEAARKETSR